MKITNVRTLLMDASYTYFNIDYLFILIETDEGITGIGEASSWPGCPMVVGAIDEMRPFILGKDALDIEALTQFLHRRFHYLGISGVVPTAISGIEIALWDIMGKKTGMPLYKLLGGRCQPEVKVYANYWAQEINHVQDPKPWAEAALKTVQSGFKALKFTPIAFPGPKELNRSIPWSEIAAGIKKIAAVREAVGDDIELYLEMAGKFDVPTAIKIAKAIEPYRIGFIEEPVPPENVEAMREVRSKSPIPVAAGERLYGRAQFRPYFEAGALDIAQPDLLRTGGYFETRKIAAMAETYYLPVAPHNAGGPVGTMATMHFALNCPNFEVLEFRVGDVPWRDTCITPAIKIENGIMIPPDGPGLEIQLNEDVINEHPHKEVPPEAFM